MRKEKRTLNNLGLNILRALALIGLFCETIFGALPNYSVDFSKADGKVGFVAIGNPSALKIRGKTKKLKDNLSGGLEIKNGKVTGKLLFSLDSLKTGMKLRDKHMKKKYLQTQEEQNAKASLDIKELILPEDFFKNKSFEAKKISFKGDFTVHGKTLLVENGTLSLERDDEELEIEVKFNIILSQFGIAIPEFMGITLAEKVIVYAELDDLILKDTL